MREAPERSIPLAGEVKGCGNYHYARSWGRYLARSCRGPYHELYYLMIKSEERVVREGNKKEEGEQGEVEEQRMKGGISI